MNNKILKHKKCMICKKHFLGDQESRCINQRFLTLRQEIDNIDDKIFGLLEKRFRITDKIMQKKRKNNLIVDDKSREKGLINRESNKSRLNKRFIKNIYKLIFKESKTKLFKKSFNKKLKNK